MCKLRILSALFALLFCGALSAQDVISTKDGREIEAKVLEVGTEELVYKKWSNPDGPDYHILLSEVLQVRYENGEVETYGASLSAIHIECQRLTESVHENVHETP